MIVETLSNLATAENVTNLRAVHNLLEPAKTGAYFMDRNSDNTNTPDFNRQLEEQKKKLRLQERRVREMRASEDLLLIYEQNKLQKIPFKALT